ncbi:unnamed protein product, partial [marine sediment metagenome]
MSTGSPDYWATLDNRMNSILSLISASVAEGGALYNALDSMDTKLNGVVELAGLSEEQIVLLGKLFSVDTVDDDGRNLLTKLDALDGKIDGVMNLDKLETMTVFYHNLRNKPWIREVLEALDGTVGTLKSSIDELVGVHADTTAMLAFSSEDWSGVGGGAGTCHTLISSISQKRNMLKVTNNTASPIGYARTVGINHIGFIGAHSSVTFYDSPGVWVVPGSYSW